MLSSSGEVITVGLNPIGMTGVLIRGHKDADTEGEAL